MLGGRNARRPYALRCVRNDEAGGPSEISPLLGDGFPAVGDDRRATETQTDHHLLSSGVEGVGINATGKRLGLFAELGMNAAQTVLVQENTRPIALMGQTVPLLPRRPGIPDDCRLTGWNAIVRVPSLFFDPPALLVGDLDEMLPTTTAAIMTGPVLDCRQFETKSSHWEKAPGRSTRNEKKVTQKSHMNEPAINQRDPWTCSSS